MSNRSALVFVYGFGVIMAATIVWMAMKAQQNNRLLNESSSEILAVDREDFLEVVALLVTRHQRPKTSKEGWHRYVGLLDEIQEEAGRAIDPAWAKICDPQDPVCRIIRLAQERGELLRWLQTMRKTEEGE